MKVAFLAISACIVSCASQPLSKFSTSLLSVFDSADEADAVVSFHMLEEFKIGNNDHSLDRTTRLNNVNQQLKERSTALHAPLIAALGKDAASIFSAYINGKVYIRKASRELLERVAAVENVKAITVQVVVQQNSHEGTDSDGPPNFLKYAIDRIEAPTAWEAGIRGHGVVVGTIDTGVRHTHEALRGNWRQEYGWFDAQNHTTIPTAYTESGTHDLGLIVGTVGQIGVAPNAQWISCAGFNENGVATEQQLIECSQFLLCPTNPLGENPDCSKAPHVISNGWGVRDGEDFYDDVLVAWRAADIIPVFAVGDGGLNGCATATYPGTSPLVIGVGGVDDNEILMPVSGRGPTIGGHIKPDVVAPSDRIVSAGIVNDENYRSRKGTKSGAALVAGTVALYLSVNPSSTYDEVYQAITMANTDVLWPYDGTCDGYLDTPYPNNGLGSGRLSARMALSLFPSATTCSMATTWVDYPGNDIISTARHYPTECCADCLITPNCILFTWTYDNGGTCWLKHSKSKRVFNDNAISGFVSSEPTACTPLLQDTEFSFFDIGTTSRPSPDLCCDDCRGWGNCRSFSWSNANGGTCTLKDHTGDKKYTEGVVSSTVVYIGRS